MKKRRSAPKVDGKAQHREWLALTDQSGPFLTQPVLMKTWPSLQFPDNATVTQLRAAYDTPTWSDWILNGLLEWGDQLRTESLDRFTVTDQQYDATVTADFALADLDEPEQIRLLGLRYRDQKPTARIPGDAWPATPVDRMVELCRRHKVELGLVDGGRWWALVWARPNKVTATCVFDTATWNELADRVVVAAFRALLHRSRFFAAPDGEHLPDLLVASGNDQEDVTEALGVQVRNAVEMLVEAIGRFDVADRAAGGSALRDIDAEEVYQAAVSVMMRAVFLLFAEERGLLPLDNPVYASGYSAALLGEELKTRADQSSGNELEQSYAAWRRLLAVFNAVHNGIDHDRMPIPAYDGSIFDPDRFPWLSAVDIDDWTVMHMLQSVQYVTVKKERRRLSFKTLDVEQIGYVYEGLLSFDAHRAADLVVGLVGKSGSEEEVPLSELEQVGTDPQALATRYKASGIGSVKQLTKRLAEPDEAELARRRARLLAVVNADSGLVERLLPFAGIIRDNLRGEPTVILPSSLYVTVSSLRGDTGTHYTPKDLAEKVVTGALEPLVYSPGPLQTAEESQWRIRKPEEILALKVADIAMGSGAFLVSACRYLAGKLVESWAAHGDEAQHGGGPFGDAKAATAARAAVDADDVEADPLVLEAKRQVIRHCLYGVDINPLAVDMAKLSLWLVSMDPKRPFTFLDDRLVCGDSLLGIGKIDALDEVKDERIHRDVSAVRELRTKIENLPDETVDDLDRKRELLAEAERRVETATLYADLVVGAQLSSANLSDKAALTRMTTAGTRSEEIKRGERIDEIRQGAQEWLDTDIPIPGTHRMPLHWPLMFPEVFEAGGFDAVIGNPPFLGGKKISGVTGSAYREHLVTSIGRGVKGNADLVAYMVLRAHDLVNDSGQTGLIATNTLAQGDTREVGLDQLVTDGVTIRQAIKSEPWPSRSAQLQFCAVWTSNVELAEVAKRYLDDNPVRGISPSLDLVSRVSGKAHRLSENADIAFIGSYVLGMGFTMEPERAAELRSSDSRNTEVLFPYLNGQDLNNRPDSSASRWIIDFDERTEDEARVWPTLWSQIEQHVKPERIVKDAAKYPRMVYEWWKFWNTRPALRRSIRHLSKAIVIALVSKSVMPVMVPTGQVFAHKLGVFASDDYGFLGLLSSAFHYWWAISKSSTMKADLNYSPSDVFETFARPELTDELRTLGERLHTFRSEFMIRQDLGLTKTYNLVHDPDCSDGDIAELRRIHVDIDRAVADAYGWHDLQLDHDFHDTRQGTRYTVGPVVRQEILDRLLELNHTRYEAEVAQGLHTKTKHPKTAPKHSNTSDTTTQPGLF